MRVLADPFHVARFFNTGPGDARAGCFNDQYALACRTSLPDDFRFEVEQTYDADSVALIGKNKVVYSNLAISFFTEDRGRMKLSARAPMSEP